MFDEDDAASEEGVEASDTAEGKVKGDDAKENSPGGIGETRPSSIAEASSGAKPKGVVQGQGRGGKWGNLGVSQGPRKRPQQPRRVSVSSGGRFPKENRFVNSSNAGEEIAARDEGIQTGCEGPCADDDDLATFLRTTRNTALNGTPVSCFPKEPTRNLGKQSFIPWNAS